MITYYTEHAKKWESAIANARILADPLEAHEYENAILLPLRKRKDSPASAVNGWHEGGVCTEDYHFIAGLARKYPLVDANYNCIKSYVPDGTPQYKNETVVFGGVLLSHFGHMLVDSLTRMWYFAKNSEKKQKYVFLMMSGQLSYYKDFFQLAGLSEEDYEIVTVATQFAKVIVPDEAMFSIASVGHPDWLLFFENIKERVKNTYAKPEFDKIYLTRTQLPDEKQFEINEVFFEEFYRNHGYHVIAPEKLTLGEQINIIMNATDIVCTIGTLSHMLVFSNQETNCTILLRNAAEVIKPQVIIDLLKNYHCTYVEINKPIFPSPHAGGVVLYVPTKFFSAYVESKFLESYDVDARQEGESAVVEEYVKKYALNYRSPQAFKRIANYTAFDFVSSINYALYGVKLDKKKNAYRLNSAHHKM